MTRVVSSRIPYACCLFYITASSTVVSCNNATSSSTMHLPAVFTNALLGILAATIASAQTGFNVEVVNSGGSFNGQNITGYHIGAATSYEVVTIGKGDSFVFNDTAHQLQDMSIADGYNLPCGVVNETQISANAGPLQCGADPGSINHAYSGTHVLGIQGITGSYVCTVDSFTYGYVQLVVVGSFGPGMPSGPGIQGACSEIDALQFGGTVPPASVSGSSTTSLPYPTITPSSNSTNSSATVVTVTTKLCDVCPETVYVSTCTSGMPSMSTTPAPPTGVSPTAAPATPAETTPVASQTMNMNSTISPSITAFASAASDRQAWDLLYVVALGLLAALF